MRNQMTGQLHYGVIEQIRELLDSLPEVRSIQFLDTSGNYMLSGRAVTGCPIPPASASKPCRQILRYPISSDSDPDPGPAPKHRDLKPGLTTRMP